MSKLVCYGDQVYIEISNPAQHPNTDMRLITSNSFLDESVYGVKAQNLFKFDFRTCVFTILPSLVDSKEDLDALRSLGTELSFLCLSKADTVGEKYLQSEIHYKEQQIELTKDTLESLNKKIMEEMDRQSVNFGEIVILQHLESGYYLCAESSFHPENPNFYNLKLRKERSSACYFKFFSYSVATDRSPVDYESEMKLVSAFLNTVVTMGVVNQSKAKIAFNSEDDEKQDAKPLFPADAIKRDISQRFTTEQCLIIGTILDSKDNNKIKLSEYCCREYLIDFSQRNVIKNGDYVRLQLDDFYLTASKTIYRMNFGLYYQQIASHKYSFLNSIFQIVKLTDKSEYPSGAEVQTNSKTMDSVNETDKYYLKHFVTGYYLTIPSIGLKEPENQENLTSLEFYNQIPYFKLINTHLKNQKGVLTKNSRISLQAFQNKDKDSEQEEKGQFYMESQVEKYKISQFDINSTYYVGFKNTADKIKGNLKLVKKPVTGNEVIGSYFRVNFIRDEEIRRILEFESYADALKVFMRVLQCAIQKKEKLTPDVFATELNRIVELSSRLKKILSAEDIETKILAQEFNILDMCIRFFFYFMVKKDIKNIFEEKRFETKQAVKFIKNISDIIVHAMKNNELIHYYISQYVRVFIYALHSPSSFLTECSNESKEQAEILKDVVVELLYNFLWEKDLDTAGQLVFYEDEIFGCLDKHEDYSTNYLQVLEHYFKLKIPNLNNTIRDNFIKDYIGDSTKINKIFPKISFSEELKSFQIDFVRKDYESTMTLSSAPPEVQKYLLWVFRVINSMGSMKSIKLWSIILEYYPKDLCESLVTSPEVPAEIKNEVLKLLMTAHFAYSKVPINVIPPKIQIVLSDNKYGNCLQKLNMTIKNAQESLISDLEKDVMSEGGTKASDTKKISIHQLSLDILKEQLDILQKGDFKSLSFTLEVMKGLLTDQNLDQESLLIIHHSVSMFVDNTAKEITNKKEPAYLQAFLKNSDKIFDVLTEVDNHVIRLAFIDALSKIKEKVFKNKGENLIYENASLLPIKSSATGTSSFAAFEKEIMESIIGTESNDWKIKKKLYDLTGHSGEMYTEDKLLAALWKIVETQGLEITNPTVDLLKNKANFESKLISELFECTLLFEEDEVDQLIQLIESLLNLNRILRKVKLIDEFKLSDKEKEDTLDEIIKNLEEIFLIIYDFESHMREEDLEMTRETAKEIFLQRFRYSKCKAPYEIPFKYKPNNIKISYQKILKVLSAYDIILPYIKILTFKTSFNTIPKEKTKLGICLTMIINILFMYQNKTNQMIFSNLNSFITGFYKIEVLDASYECVNMFTEMCKGNKRLIKLEEDYLFKTFAYTYCGYLMPFTVKNNRANARTSLPINYIRGLAVLITVSLPKDMFDPAETMKNKFFDFLEFLKVDNTISIREQISKLDSTTISDELKQILEANKESSTKILLNMPIFYTILEELLNAEVDFALTEIQERVFILQNSFTLDKTMPFFRNENIEFNFRLKQLGLKILENLYFKNIYKNMNIFIDQKQFLEFTSLLLIDVYGYLKAHIDKDDEIFALFKTSYFSSEENQKYIEKYDELNKTDIDNLVFLQYQSIIFFGRLWKDYICYVMCDFLGNLVSHFKEFMLAPSKEKTDDKTIFDVWLELLEKISEINDVAKYQVQINNAFKNVVVHSEYSRYRDKISEILKAPHRMTHETKTHIVKMQQQKWKPDIQNLVSKYLGDRKKYKLKLSERNLKNIIVTLSSNKIVLKKLIHSISVGETSDNHIMFILKLCRIFIEIEGKNENNKGQAIYRWVDVSASELKIISRSQDILNELNIVGAVFFLFSRYENNYIILREVIVLCIALLFGGNKSVQDSFYERFKFDFDNDIIENFVRILEVAFESFRLRQGPKTKANYLDALKFIFENLKDPDPQIVISEDIVEIPDHGKEKLIATYSKNTEKKENIFSLKTQQALNLSLSIMKFFQSLCENHHFNFQEFLRDQTILGHTKSSNIPEFLRQIYQIYHRELNVDNVRIGSQILGLLIELEQGESLENVKLLLRRTFLSDLCNTLNGFNGDLDLLSRGFGFNASHPQFMLLKSKALLILKDLVERSDVSDLKKISQYINLRSLVYTFKQNIIAFHKIKGKYPEKESLYRQDLWDQNLSSAFMVYFILRHLSFEESSLEFSTEIRDLLDEAFKNNKGIETKLADQYIHRFFRQYTGSIEILKKKNNRLMRIYFPIPVVFLYLKQDIMLDFMEKVDRSNAQAKLTNFIDTSNELISQMNSAYKSRNRLFGLNFSVIYSWLRLFTNIVSIAITLLNMIQLEYIDGTVKYRDDTSNSAHQALSAVQAVISFLLVNLWFYTKLNRHLAYKWDQFVGKNIKEQGMLPSDFIHKLDDNPTIEMAEAVFELKGPYTKEWEYVEHMMFKKYLKKNFIFLWQSMDFLWHLCYFGICIASSFHPLVAAFQLFDLVVRSDTVSRIATSVSRNARQFLWTFVLLLVTVYVYSLIGLYFLHSRFQDDHGNDLCTNAYACFLASLNQGLRAGGGIGDVIKQPVYTEIDAGTYFLDALFDLSFFILMITLLLNLIFGMIIDAFGQLRDEKNKNEDDKKNVCFICGLSRSEYERTSSFDKHIIQDHNLWQYLAYIVYLQEKNKTFATELTDIESYVLDRYTKKDTAWFPVGRSLTIERLFAKEEKDVKSEVAMLREDMIDAIGSVVNQTKNLENKLQEVFDNVVKGKKISKKLTQIIQPAK